MNSDQRIAAFTRLGEVLASKLESGAADEALERAYHENNWFTVENSTKAIRAIINDFLNKEKLEKWLGRYNLVSNVSAPKSIGLVMAGNIPLVGWHDLLCVLITVNSAQIKLSSKDQTLPKLMINTLLEVEPGFENNIRIVERLKDFDAIIATGSGNTMRYFEYYFGKYPHILRMNRNAVAVLTGKETDEMLSGLGKDITEYYGLGCRNVSKLFVPEGYDFPVFFRAIEHYNTIMDHFKYANNYNYNKSLLLLNKEKHLDNGFMLLKESEALASPISVLNYQYYKNTDNLITDLEAEKDTIQCIVSMPGIFENSVDFGQTQRPQLWDYADGVDTLEFLLKL